MTDRRLNVPGRASAWYLASGMFTKAIGILSTPIFTRLMSTEDYGSFSFYLSVIGIACGIVAPFCSGSQIYSVISKFKNKSCDCFLPASLPTLGFCGVVCLFLFTFARYFGFDFQTIFFISFQILFDSLILLYLSFERYDYRYKKVITVIISEALLSPILSVILINALGLGYIGRVLGLLIPSGSIAITILLTHIYKNRRVFQKEAAYLILESGSPLLPNAILGSVTTQSDRIIIAYILGQAAIAKYSVAHSVGVGLYFVITSLSSALTPWMIRRLDAGEGRRISNIVGIIGISLGACSLFLIALAPEALLLLAPSEYSDAVGAVAPIALSTVPAFFSATASAILIHKGYGRRLTSVKLISLFVGVVSGLLLIPRLGYFGAGMGVFLSEICSAIATILFLNKSDDKAKIFSINSLAYSISIPICVGAFISLFSPSLPIRILLLIIPTTLLMRQYFPLREFITEKRS